MQDQTPEVISHKGEIIESLRDAVEFGSYEIEDHRMVDTVAYNDQSGKLYLYIYTFEGYLKPNQVHKVACSSLKITVDFKLPRDWIIVAKFKASMLQCSMCQELQFLPEKSMSMENVVDAISVALAPAVLGLIKLPPPFLKIMSAAFKTQIDNPNGDVRPAPNPELAAQSLKLMDQFEQNQKQIISDIEKQLGFGLNSDEGHHHMRNRMRIPERHYHRHHHHPYDFA
ncbi:hypothetical protein TVAG_053570 [Trichomonas vaginalis G3]|uniref:Uncharacterized protein n=2 Tax=Trichomonas vaginalis (strain ATCC PRA-98 / G3) TaxID=412133 RepID=A2EMW0_TRIV3|nr:hypothetical protein TVAG_053570 [Trichomonas vaginalis G3]|eukprot:XP_001318256.1 hypothetical protein [Trichomonas vaginalis G3]